MSSPNGPVNKANLRKKFYVPCVRRTFDPRTDVLASTDFRDPMTNQYYDYGTIWHNTTDDRFFILARITANLGKWLLFTGGNGVIISQTGDDGIPVFADGLGNFNWEGLVVPNGTNPKPLYTSGDDPSSLERIELQVGAAVIGPPADTNDAGIVSFNPAQFNVDPNGWTTLAGGTTPPILFLEGDTGGPVGPDSNGTIFTEGDNTQQFIQINGTPASNLLEALLIEPAEDAELLIGQTGVGPTVGTLVSSDASINITYTAPNIDLTTNASPLPTASFANLGMTIDTGTATITIHSADGSALSSTNQAEISIPSKAVPGTFVTCIIQSNVSMIFSEMDNNTMGTVASLAWANNMPLYLYAVLNDAENDCALAWARAPNHSVCSTAANTGTPSSATADDYTSFFFFDSITIADYEQNTCLCLGSARANKNSSDQWVFSALLVGEEGIGQYNEKTLFNFPLGQNGSSANSLFYSVATVPTLSSCTGVYSIQKNGNIFYDVGTGTVTGAGSGANTLFLMLPYRPELIRGGSCFTIGTCIAAGPHVFWGLVFFSVLPNGHWGVEFVRVQPTRLQAGNITTTGQFFLSGSMNYLAYGNR